MVHRVASKTSLYPSALTCKPDLDPELTQVEYDVTAGGQPYHGSFLVPGKGTSALAETAKAAPKLAVVEGVALPEAPGPHGGTVEPVGDGKTSQPR